MKILYYPNRAIVKKVMQADDPLLVLVSYDGKQMLIGGLDDCFEHVILLRKLKIRETAIDAYFRLLVNKEGADWTFVCPVDYKGILNRQKRIEKFYADGIGVIKKALKKIGYAVPINIPKRFRRHFVELGNGN
ncbi:MAG: hypothetical protein WC901_03910 [Candidatus Margulisiibacteriota bacterium]